MREDGSPSQLDTAIDMAVYSGNVLYEAQDEAHAWALTLIISNLFELIGQGDSSADRFADGFSQVAGFADPHETVIGWDPLCVARAIRNWIDHGLRLDRPQEMNSTTRTRAIVESIDFIPLLEETSDDEVYRVYFTVRGSYVIHFSPNRFWLFVQRWIEGKRP